MALALDPERLYRDIRAAEDSRAKYLDQYENQIARYHGGAYWSGGNTKGIPENHYYESVSLVVPRLIFGDPRVRVRTRRPGSQRITAEAIRHALNRWCATGGVRDTLRDVAVDMLFNCGWTLTTSEPWEGVGPGLKVEERMWPRTVRVDPRRMLVDPYAVHWDEVRWIGHVYAIDKADLLDREKERPEEKWDREIIESLAPDGDMTLVGRDKDKSPASRDELLLYDLWVPEVQTDGYPESEGYHGSLVTLAMQGSDSGRGSKRAQSIRQIGFYGSREGPYTRFSVYPVPGHVHPLGPITAVEAQIEAVNRFAFAIRRQAERYKRGILVSDQDPTLADTIMRPDGNVTVVKNAEEIARRVIQYELGGTSADFVQYLEYERDRLDRNSGIDDTTRGQAPTDTTATATAVAAAGANTRLSYVQSQFRSGVEAMLRKVAYVLYHEDRVELPLGQEAAEALAPMNPEWAAQAAAGRFEPWWQGGDPQEGSGATYEDLELEIEPYSMHHQSDAEMQQRTMTLLGIVGQLAPLVRTFPEWNWNELVQNVTDDMRLSLSGNLVDIGLARQLAGLQMMMQQPPPSLAQPRLGRDAGATGLAPVQRFAVGSMSPPGGPGAQKPPAMGGTKKPAEVAA